MIIEIQKAQPILSHSGIPVLVRALKMALLYLDGEYIGTEDDLRDVIQKAILKVCD